MSRFPTFDPDGQFSRMRRAQYGRLDADGHVYLDYTGGGLHAVSQVEAHAELLRTSVLGNPHSNNPSSLAATKLVERTRRQVCEYFNAPAGRVRVHLHGQRQCGAPVGRRVLPVRTRWDLCAHVRQPQLRQRHPRVRPSQGRSDRLRARSSRPNSGWTGRRCRVCWPPATPRCRTCSRFRRSRTSPASSIRSTWSTRRTTPGGTYCSMRPHSRRRTDSMSPASGPTSRRSRSTS